MDDNASATILKEFFSAYRARIIYWTVKLKIADHLMKQPMTAEDLAKALNAHAPSIARFLNFLNAMRLTEQDEQKRYSLTKYGLTLTDDHESSVKSFITLFHSKYLMEAEMNFEHTLRTGENAFNKQFGKDIYEFLKDNDSADLSIYTLVKLQRDYMTAAQGKIIQSYDFARFNHIVDLGGCYGTLLIQILQNTPTHVRGTVVDQPHIAAKAVETIAEHKLSERCEAIGADLLAALPVEGDCYIVKFVLVGYNDEKYVQIVRNISKRMKHESRLLIMEPVDSEEGDSFIQMMDYASWVVDVNGSNRKLSQHENLLREANLKVLRLINAGELNFSIIEAALQ